MMNKHLRTLMPCLLITLTTTATPLLAKDTPKQNTAQLDKGLTLDAWYGGWEPDYTKTAYEAMLSYRAIDKLHLFTGMGESKQVFYDRSKIYGGAYYFYEDYSFFKMFLSERTYKYPTLPGAVAPNPDANSYEKVPKLELEVSQYIDKNMRTTVSYELSQPNFYHDKGTKFTVHKLGAELAVNTPIPQLRAKVFTSILRDPDPNTTTIIGFANQAIGPTAATATTVNFRNTSLFGGAVQYVAPQWNLETKYMQNRDLDNSYDFSLLNKFSYQLTDESALQLDYVHDVFSNQSNLRGNTANVYMASYYKQHSKDIKYGFGLKHIGVPNNTQDTAFVYLQFRSGVVW